MESNSRIEKDITKKMLCLERSGNRYPETARSPLGRRGGLPSARVLLFSYWILIFIWFPFFVVKVHTRFSFHLYGFIHWSVERANMSYGRGGNRTRTSRRCAYRFL